MIRQDKINLENEIKQLIKEFEDKHREHEVKNIHIQTIGKTITDNGIQNHKEIFIDVLVKE